MYGRKKKNKPKNQKKKRATIKTRYPTTKGGETTQHAGWYQTASIQTGGVVGGRRIVLQERKNSWWNPARSLRSGERGGRHKKGTPSGQEGSSPVREGRRKEITETVRVRELQKEKKNGVRRG